MKKVAIWITLLGLIVAVSGCAAPAPQALMESRTSGAPAVAPAAPPAPAAANGQGQKAAPGALAAADFIQADAARMIIQTVDMNLVVNDAGATLQTLTALVSGQGGYVASSSIWRVDEQLRAKASLRVPADKLQATLAEMRRLAIRVDRENANGQDVTEEFTDLSAQLKNLEAAEQQLRELMAEVRQRTQKAEDILQIYRELEQKRMEIERVKGRMQYLNQRADLATINVELIPDALSRPVVEAGWRPAETVRNASRQLVQTMQGIAQAGIWLILYVVPVLIAIAIPIVLLVLFLRWLYRRGRRPGPKPTATGTPAA